MKNTSFYRTRHFWVVIYSLMLAWSVFFYFSVFSFSIEHPALRTVNELAMSLGGSFWGMWGRVFLDQIGALIGILIYFSSQLYLLSKTMRNTNVLLRYPALFLFNYFAGMAMLLFFLGGLT